MIFIPTLSASYCW